MGWLQSGYFVLFEAVCPADYDLVFFQNFYISNIKIGFKNNNSYSSNSFRVGYTFSQLRSVIDEMSGIELQNNR